MLALKENEGAHVETSVKYIDSLTPMRGLAALWVMLFHIDVSLFYRDMGALLPRDQTGLLSHGYLWVDFFFILSGFIMAHVFGDQLARPGKFGHTLDYLWARLARIYPLHLFCLALVVVIALVYPLIIPNVRDGSWETFMAWKAIPSNLLMTHAMNQHVYLSWDIVSWSIGAEWWTYVLTVPVLIWLHRAPVWIGGMVMAAGFAGLVALVYALPDKTLDITFNYGFVRCLCEFVIGLGLYRLYRAGRAKNLAHDAVVIVLLAVIVGVFHFRLNDLIIVPVFALLILSVSANSGHFHRVLQMRPLQYLGRISYSLYLVHGVVFSALWFVLPWFKSQYHPAVFNTPEKLAYMALFISLVLAISHLTYRYVERPARLFLLSLRKNTATGSHI